MLLPCGVQSVLSCRRHACCVAGKTGDTADLKVNTSRATVEATDIADVKVNTSRTIAEATDDQCGEVEGERDVRTR